MPQPLMPMATAVWLVENTSLTFEQIADFCGIHPLEVQGIADGEVAQHMVGVDPTQNGQLAWGEIEKAQADPKKKLTLLAPITPYTRTKGARYTPVSKRQDRPDAISWLIRYHPELSDAQLCRLVGTTKATIEAVRGKTHWNASNIRPQDPVGLGLCSQSMLDEAVRAAAKRRPADAVTPMTEAADAENEE